VVVSPLPVEAVSGHCFGELETEAAGGRQRRSFLFDIGLVGGGQFVELDRRHGTALLVLDRHGSLGRIVGGHYRPQKVLNSSAAVKNAPRILGGGSGTNGYQ